MHIQQVIYFFLISYLSSKRIRYLRHRLRQISHVPVTITKITSGQHLNHCTKNTISAANNAQQLYLYKKNNKKNKRKNLKSLHFRKYNFQKKSEKGIIFVTCVERERVT